MSFPRVTILCPEVGSNALGRSLLLARLLPPEARPEVLGLTTRDAIWAPARSHGVPVESFRVDRARGLGAARSWLRERVRGDVLIASKPLPTSLGLALASEPVTSTPRAWRRPGRVPMPVPPIATK